MAESTIDPWGGIKISDVRLLNPPSSLKNPKFQIVINCGGQERTSRKNSAARKGDHNCVIWNEPFIFAGGITDDTLLTFTVIRVRSVQVIPNNTIDSCKRRVIELLEIQSSSGSCKLDITGKCQLTFNIEKSSGVVSEVVTKIPVIGNRSDLEVEAGAATDAVGDHNDEEQALLSFLHQFQKFMEVIDDVSEISPYAKIAWSILSAIPKTIIAQKFRDDNIKQLYIKLKDTYEYITDAKRLRELTPTQHKTLSILVQQTIECAYFIKAYRMENTVKNVIKGISGSIDSKIQDFNDKFDHLMKVMTHSVELETGIVTLRVSVKINELNEFIRLGDIPYDEDAGFFPGKRCLPGTRQMLINEMLEWVYNDASPQILVLSGQAGSGKSAVAHTIAGIFQEHNRLGSIFCFNRSFTDRRNYLFSTISCDLAASDPLWGEELMNVIQKPSVRKKKDAETQFEELIVKPSKKAATPGPVLIVVDALDESGDRNERKEILGFFLDRWSELPKNYRIIITTRPEQDIELRCQNPNVLCKRIGDIDAEETRRDIQAYVSSRLGSISSILDDIDKNWGSILAKRAEGLFQWAQTACRFIDTKVTLPELVEENWKTCVSSSSLSLYGLYHQIISSQPESRHTSFKEKFKTIVGAIITAREPLSINALQNILYYIKDIRSMLIPFSSFFIGVHDLSTPVRPLHTSLFDFFIARETNDYYIDTSDQSHIALACLKLMNRMLCFNICHLETSHLRNQEVPDLNSRVERAIPSHLSYSCCFWAFHLQSSAHSEELVREIRGLMDYNLLYFFEVLSLLKAVDQGCVAMREIVNWCNDADSGLAADAMDAWEFGYDFGEAMMESTPHLYLSALPFTPRGSFLSKKYLEVYPGLFTFDIGQPVASSRKIGITQKYALGATSSITFSPQGKHIATGSTEGEFWVWNYVTGERLLREIRPKVGKGPYHMWGVCDIVYSCDGEFAYCRFEDGDILVWHTGTNETSIERYMKVIDARSRFCTISSDGCFVTWCTEKGRLLFDRKNHRIVFNHGISIYSISYPIAVFSPNGDWLAVYRRNYGVQPGSWVDSRAYIWNTREQTRHDISCGVMEDLALTDSYIAFRNDDRLIEIRDVRANTKVTEIQHEMRVECFQFSPDNQYILSASNNVYSIWRVSTGELISQSYVDSFICCLGFSHDSKLVALGTSDGTINVRQWGESVELIHPRGKEITGVYEIWLRGTYLILWYVTTLDRAHLQISDITTTNTIVFEVELKSILRPVSATSTLDLDLPINFGLVSVLPDEENVRVAYVTSRGLCLWNEKEGEIVVDGSDSSFTALGFSDKYLISGDESGIIKIWDSCTRKLICGPITVPYGVRNLQVIGPARGTHFAVVYGDNAEIRECESGDKVGVFTFEPFTLYDASVAFSANETHVICMSENGVDILDLSTRIRVNLISFPPHSNPERQISLNGKYLTWIDNGKMKLFDADTGTSLTSPSLTLEPIKKSWFSNDSSLIIIASSAVTSGNTRAASLDIWDMQSENTIIKTIRYQFNFPEDIKTLALSNRRLVGLIKYSSQCSVWDLDTYEIMSNTLYNFPPLTDGPNIEGKPASNKMEMLDYAFTAWKKASLPAFAEMDKGWVLGLQGELLFWVPEKRRKQFWFPCVMHVPHRNVTKLNFNNFVHGTSWTECRKRTSM